MSLGVSSVVFFTLQTEESINKTKSLQPHTGVNSSSSSNAGEKLVDVELHSILCVVKSPNNHFRCTLKQDDCV